MHLVPIQPESDRVEGSFSARERRARRRASPLSFSSLHTRPPPDHPAARDSLCPARRNECAAAHGRGGTTGVVTSLAWTNLDGGRADEGTTKALRISCALPLLRQEGVRIVSVGDTLSLLCWCRSVLGGREGTRTGTGNDGRLAPLLSPPVEHTRHAVKLTESTPRTPARALHSRRAPQAPTFSLPPSCPTHPSRPSSRSASTSRRRRSLCESTAATSKLRQTGA